MMHHSHKHLPWHLCNTLFMLAIAIFQNSCSAFSPRSRVQLKNAVDICLKISPKGMCSKGPHGPIGKWDVSRVTDMNRIFAGAESFDGDLSKWDVSGVKNMQGMFLRAKSFNGDISNWDVSNVNDMHGMFMGATHFNRKLCGSAWVHSRAKKTVMFDGSSGSISTKTCTDIAPFSAFSPRTSSELKSAVGAYLKLSPNRYLRTGYCRNHATRLFSARQFSSQARTEVDKDQTITIYPSDPKISKPTAGIVFLHGLGDTAHGWSETCAQLEQLQPALANVKWVLPTAKSLPITLNMGAVMPAWFDVTGLRMRNNEENPGIGIAQERVKKIVADLAAEVGGMSRVVLGGFSQGGALALYTALQMDDKEPLGGVIVLSGWLPMHTQFPKLLLNKKTPVLHCHGERDPMVLYEDAAITSRDMLKEMGVTVDFRSYRNLEHEANMAEITDVSNWLVKHLNL